MIKKLNVNNENYEVITLLGKGKGGYSYLVKKDNIYYVIKQIHHEPCDYYTFGNKLESEINDYYKLLLTDINMPKLIEIDYENERILKEYIDGKTIMELSEENLITEIHIKSVNEMANMVYKHNLNIDFYPTNFVYQNDKLYYIDYECNIYDSKWNLANWGIKYWKNKKEMND
jgi:tRNA A-37 threonylcarbamoyl transferase component Bud32